MLCLLFQANYTLAPQPMPSSVQSYSGNGSYYGSNLANYGNYGSYNPAYTSSPSSAGTAAASGSNSSSYNYGHHHHGLPATTDTTNKSSDNLYVTSGDQDKQRYSVHVRASPISPTYSQFSNGVSVKNCYPPFDNKGTLRGHLRKPDVEDYSVYVNSTAPTSATTPSTVRAVAAPSAANSSLATHV